MRGAIPPFPQYISIAWYLIKYRDNFTFNCTFTLCRSPIWFRTGTSGELLWTR